MKFHFKLLTLIAFIFSSQLVMANLGFILGDQFWDITMFSLLIPLLIL